jgi:cell division protein YceG involved in septum cleavage
MEVDDVLWTTVLVVLLSLLCASAAVFAILVKNIAALYRERQRKQVTIPQKLQAMELQTDLEKEPHSTT